MLSRSQVTSLKGHRPPGSILRLVHSLYCVGRDVYDVHWSREHLDSHFFQLCGQFTSGHQLWSLSSLCCTSLWGVQVILLNTKFYSVWMIIQSLYHDCFTYVPSFHNAGQYQHMYRNRWQVLSRNRCSQYGRCVQQGRPRWCTSLQIGQNSRSGRAGAQIEQKPQQNPNGRLCWARSDINGRTGQDWDADHGEIYLSECTGLSFMLSEI